VETVERKAQPQNEKSHCLNVRDTLQEGKNKIVLPPPTVSENQKKIPLLSYFTGAGLLDLGFMNHGFDVIWRNEFNPWFVKGFEHAMSALTKTGNHKINSTESIGDLTPQEVMKQAFNNVEKPETFGIIGGPPCTDFSVGGKNHGEHGKNGKLAETYVNHILIIQPSFFVLENVKGLFQTGKHKSFLDKLIAKLEPYYIMDTKILNALEYGVPQHRERGFLVGFHKKWLEKNTNFEFFTPDWFPWAEKLHNEPKKYKWPKRVSFGSEPEKPEGIPADLMIGTWICNPELDLSILPNGLDQFNARSDKFNTIDEGDDTRKSFKRLHRWRYSPTAAYGNNEVHLHPIYPRRLSVREVMVIQSIPNEYALPDDIPLSHKYKMIGNGVPVKLADAVASSFAKITSGNYTFDNVAAGINQPLLFSASSCMAPQLQEDESGQI
jgi:DNA (cytosine-5)-methyltransferase 1